ncbi:MAG: hypothetical protein GX548_05325 [Lentisphaerae bacterium]|nr:hypothetical protein [Lentisphaerota bacterium]
MDSSWGCGAGADPRNGPGYPSRGLFLHASSVVTSRGALLFLGHSTAGKSTMTRLLGARFRVLADDAVFATRRDDGRWQVVDGGFRYDGGGVADWQQAVHRSLEAGEGIPLAGCLRIFKAADVRREPMAPLPLARCLMDAAMEIDVQRKNGRPSRAHGVDPAEWTPSRDMRRTWFHLAADLARSCPGWKLWFSRDAHREALIRAVCEAAGEGICRTYRESHLGAVAYKG